MEWPFGTYGALNTIVGNLTSRVPVSIRPRMVTDARPVDMLHQLSQAWIGGLTYKDINEDQGIYDSDSIIGVEVMREASCHKLAGDEQLKSKLYNGALSSYTKALELWIQIKDNGDHLSATFTKRSVAHRMLKDYDKAFEDVIAAIRCCPVLTEASLQLTHIYEAMGKFEEAFEICATSAVIYTNRVAYLTLASRLASKARGGVQTLALQVHSDEHWQQTLNVLANEGSWSTVRILAMGTDDLPPLVSPFDASEISLASLVDFSSRDNVWKNWGQKLTQLLLRQGASHQTICSKGKYPFHVALRTGLQTDTFDLLKWLLTNKTNNVDHINSILDDRGDSLLHTSCRSTSDSKSTAIQLLLNYTIETSITNKENKTALDYLGKHDPGYDVIKKYEAKKSGKVCAATATRVGSTEMDKVESSQPLRTTLSATRAQPPLATALTQIVQCFEHIKSWSKPQVMKWLENNDLSQYKTMFRDIDGSRLYELKMMQNVAPEMFYKVLQESLELSLNDLLKVSSSLRQIREDIPS